MGTFLIILGLACILGAIVGGGIKVASVHIGSVASLGRQALLAIFGGGLIYVGMGMGSGLFGGSSDVNVPAEAVSTTEAVENSGP